MFCLLGTWAARDKPIYLLVEPTVKYNYREHGDASELLGDVIFSNHTFLYYALVVWRKYLSICGMEKRGGKKVKSNIVHLFPSWKIFDHCHIKVDTDEIWICRLTQIIY